VIGIAEDTEDRHHMIDMIDAEIIVVADIADHHLVVLIKGEDISIEKDRNRHIKRGLPTDTKVANMIISTLKMRKKHQPKKEDREAKNKITEKKKMKRLVKVRVLKRGLRVKLKVKKRVQKNQSHNQNLRVYLLQKIVINEI